MAENARWFIVHTYSGYEDSVASNILTVVENRKMKDQIFDVKIPTVTDVTIAKKNLNIVKISSRKTKSGVVNTKVGIVKFKIQQGGNDFYYRGKGVNDQGEPVLYADEKVIDKVTNTVAYEPREFIITKNTIDEETGEETATITFKKSTEHKRFPGYVFVKVACFYKRRSEEEDEELSMSDESWYVIRNTRGVTGFVGPDSKKPVPLSDEEVAKLDIEKKEIVVSFKEGDTVNILSGPLDGYSGVVSSIDLEKEVVVVVTSMLGRDTPVELGLDQVELVD